MKLPIPETLVRYLKSKIPKEGITFFKTLKREKGELNVVLSTPEREAYYKGESYTAPAKDDRTSFDDYLASITNPMLSIPNPVHFMEGMAVRNLMRGSGMCPTWDDEDYDDNWIPAIEKLLEQYDEENDGGE